MENNIGSVLVLKLENISKERENKNNNDRDIEFYLR